MQELLAVEFPSLEITESEKNTVLVTSTCVSIENIKFIHDILYKDLANLEKIDSAFVKYVDRIQFFIENKDNTSIYSDIFTPNVYSFKFTQMYTSKELSEEEFSDANHYILFQEVKINEPKEKTLELQKWQKCLVEILLETDLTSYCNKLSNGPPTAFTNKNPLRELFWQIHKAPTGFLIDSNKSGQVKVMAYFLSEYFENRNETKLFCEFNFLRDYYQNTVDSFLEKQQRLEQSLHRTVNSLANRIAGIELRIKHSNNNLLQCILARKILDTYSCSYEIHQEMGSPTKKLQKKDPGVITKGEPKKYTINFESNDKKSKSKPKAKPNEVQRITKYFILYYSFLTEYSQFMDITHAIICGEDKSNICRIFYDYFSQLKNYIFTACDELSEFSENDKEEVFKSIYDYSMVVIYNKIFPHVPSTYDKELSAHFSQLKNLTVEQLEIKPENQHSELWDLCIKSNVILL